MIITANGRTKSSSIKDALLEVIEQISEEGLTPLSPPTMTLMDKCGHYKYSCKVKVASDVSNEAVMGSPAWRREANR